MRKYCGAAERTWTFDRLVNSQPLYLAELRRHSKALTTWAPKEYLSLVVHCSASISTCRVLLPNRFQKRLTQAWFQTENWVKTNDSCFWIEVPDPMRGDFVEVEPFFPELRVDSSLVVRSCSCKTAETTVLSNRKIWIVQNCFPHDIKGFNAFNCFQGNIYQG